jgi:ABC-2 type transport system ATP-binding protein
MIKVDNITKRYGKTTVLDDVTVKFESGHIYGLVGVNGCGKTTLMRCICGFTRPSSGTITVQGKVIGKDADFAPSTGVIIETPGFLPHYSALRNLMILASISKRANKDRVEQVIRRLGLNPGDKKPVGMFSLGMRQRLGIAQAIMEDPEVLILDEPFNGLDVDANADIHQLFAEMRDAGKTLILASHSAYDVNKACDCVYRMEGGKLHA